MQMCPCIRLRLWRQHGRGWQTRWANLITASPTTTTATAAMTSPASIGPSRGIGSAEIPGTSDPGAQRSLPVHQPGSTSLLTGAATAEPEDEEYLVGRNYRRDDKAFWGRYKDLWGAAADAVAADAFQGEASLGHTASEPLTRNSTTGVARQEARSPNARGPAKKPVPVRRWKRATGDAVRKAAPRKSTTPKQRPQAFLGQLGHLRRSCLSKDFGRANAAFWRWKQSLAATWEMLEASILPQTGAESHLLRWLLESGRDSAGSASITTLTRIESMRTAWKTLPDTRRRNAWPELMISVLRSRPADAPAVFQATFDASLVPSYLAEDTLHYLIRQHVSPPPSASPLPPTAADELFSSLRAVLENSPDGYLRLQQATIYFYTRSIPTANGVSQLYDMLVAHKHPLHENTRLQIAGRLAADPAYKMQAVYVLQAMLEATGLDINTPKGAALCTSILSVRRGGGAEGTVASLATTPKRPPPSGAPAVATPAEMFELLLRCGLEPNLITYTTILRDLCLARELDAAQQVLQLMIEKNKIEPDAYVYSTMLNGAKLCGDFPMLRQVATSAAAQGIRHPFVWNDFLQALYATAFSEARRNPATAKRPRVVPAFPLMLQAYTRLFALGPLHTILPTISGRGGFSKHGDSADDDGHPSLTDAAMPLLPSNAMQHWDFSAQMAHTVHELPLLPPSDRMQPTGATLATMVLGYIQGLSNPYDVIAFYSHFRRLLQEGDAVAVGLVREQGTVVHDAVVMALCDFESMLRVALDVLGDMLRDAQAAPNGATEAAPLSSPSSSAFPHPPPSAYTWSILLNGFMFHRQSLQGERILHMMRERGIAPNQVTWNTLVAGYARQQNARKTASALQRLERAGFEPDEFTLRAFSYLHNKWPALQHLESRGRAAAAVAAAAQAAEATEGAGTAEATAAGAATGNAKGEAVAGGPASALAAADSNDLGAGGSGISSSSASEMRELANEVERISRMMDDEQRGTAAAPTAKAAAAATRGHAGQV